MNAHHYLAFDIGGTDIKFGVLDEQGHILEKGKIKTESSGEAIIDALVTIKERYQSLYRLQGAAFSLPGFIDVESGFMHTGGAIHDFTAFPFRAVVAERLALPVEIENDVNCVAMAEKWQGNATESKNFLCITLGTGVGGAVYLNDQLVRGHRWMAGEFGYMLTENVFFSDKASSGLSETGSVRGGIRKAYAREMKNETFMDSLSGKEVFDLAKGGDVVALSTIERFYQNVAIGLYNLTFILNPEKILIGGAISERSDLLAELKAKFQAIIEHEKIMVGMDVSDLVSIEPAKFHNDAGLIGAVYHFLTMSTWRHK